MEIGEKRGRKEKRKLKCDPSSWNVSSIVSEDEWRWKALESVAIDYCS